MRPVQMLFRRRMGMVKNNFDLNQQYDNLCNAVIKMAAKDYCKCAEQHNKSFVKNEMLISIKEKEGSVIHPTPKGVGFLTRLL